MGEDEGGRGDISISGGVRGIGHAIGHGATSHVELKWEGPPKVDLVEAEARLGEVPLDRIPAVGALPERSRMPLSRNALFTGREVDLVKLARALRGGETVAIGQTAAVTGIGGIGKTQLASEFVHRYGGYFLGGVYWLNLENAEGVPAEAASCGLVMGLRPDFGELPLEAQVALVRSAWEEATPRLLVFDNCEDEALLAEWRPKSGGARVLVTSRRGSWDDSMGVTKLALGLLSRLESVELLKRFRPEIGHEEAEAIAEELGDLPLALHLAGSYLKRYKDVVTAAGYLAELKRPEVLEHASLIGRKGMHEPTKHEMHVGRTFALSYDKLKTSEAVDVTALALLALAAYFAPGQAIPGNLLHLSLSEQKKRDLVASLVRRAFKKSTGPTPKLVADGSARLEELGLVEVEGSGWVVLHRLTAAYVRGTVEDGEVRRAVERAVARETNRINDAGLPGPLLEWQVHLRHVAEAAAQRGSESAAWLSNAMGYHLHTIGDYKGARPYYEQALAIWEKALGPEHPITATGLNNIGEMLREMGDLPGAQPYYERALAIKEKVLGPEHPDTALSLNNLGVLLDDMGDREAARPYLERALAIREKVLGPEHPDTAGSLNNLGALVRALGDYAGARRHYERALAIWEKVLGPEHPDTATGLNNLGGLLHSMGDYAGARPYFERALAVSEKVLGPEHPDTAQSLANLGFLLQVMGDTAGARPYLERALSIREKVLGLEHPDTAQSLNNLGLLQHSMGDYAGARPYLERALAVSEKALGREHPDTAQSLNSLGLLLHEMGDAVGARPYYERALAIRKKVLGPEHPDTAASLNNLGLLLHSMGDYEEARPYLERALAIYEKALGPEHPDTAKSLNNLGLLLQEMGDYEVARPYTERALAIWEKALGPEHPDTAASMNNLGLLLHSMGDYEEARPYLERALAVSEKVLGPEHPDTATSLNNLGALLRAMGDTEGARPYLEQALAILEDRLGVNHPNTKRVRGQLEKLEAAEK